MINFKIGADMIDNEIKQIVELSTKSNSLKPGEFESLIKYINEQGKVFTKVYKEFNILKSTN